MPGTPLCKSVLAVTGLASHPPLVDIDLAATARQVDGLPWVRHAVVSRHWPDSVTVTITERTPVAAVDVGGDIALVDASGRVLAWGATRIGSAASWLPPAVPGRRGRRSQRTYRPGLTALGALPALLRGRVTDVVVSSQCDVIVGFPGGVSAAFGPADELAAKYEALASVLVGGAAHRARGDRRHRARRAAGGARRGTAAAGQRSRATSKGGRQRRDQRGEGGAGLGLLDRFSAWPYREAPSIGGH